MAAPFAKPEAVCGCLKTYGLNPGRYRKLDAGRFGCLGPWHTLPYGDRLLNQIRFRALGDARRVGRLELETLVQSRYEQQATLKYLERVAGALLGCAAGIDLPPPIRDGIRAGQAAETVSGGHTLELRRSRAGTPGVDLLLRVQ